MVKVRFLQAGSWCDAPSEPVFNVNPGDERDVSLSLADVAVKAGKAEYVVDKPQVEKPQRKSKTGPIKKAEH
jgi:hypothetical protein